MDDITLKQLEELARKLETKFGPWCGTVIYPGGLVRVFYHNSSTSFRMGEIPAVVAKGENPS